jgi:hypothetical protein
LHGLHHQPQPDDESGGCCKAVQSSLKLRLSRGDSLPAEADLLILGIHSAEVTHIGLPEVYPFILPLPCWAHKDLQASRAASGSAVHHGAAQHLPWVY